MKESFASKKPDVETVKIADETGEMFEWEVSHDNGDMVYLKQYYDAADEARFIYRGMSKARFAELKAVTKGGADNNDMSSNVDPTLTGESSNARTHETRSNPETKDHMPFTKTEARTLLSYADIGEEDDEEWLNDPEAVVFTSELIDLSRKYGQAEVMKLSDEIRADYEKAMSTIGFAPSPYSMGGSVSWSMEAIAEQSYLASHPEAAVSRGYVTVSKLGNPFDPKNRAAKIREMSSRQIGLEFQGAVATAGNDAIKDLSHEDKISSVGRQKQINARRAFIDSVVTRDGKRDAMEKLVNVAVHIGQLSPEISIGLGELLRLEKTEKKSHEKDLGRELPQTFAEIRTMPGHSIEDLLDTVGDLSVTSKNWYSSALEESINKRRTNYSYKDARFMSDIENIIAYEKDIYDFSVKLHNENPYSEKRGVLHSHIGWTQHDSKEFIRSRVEDGSKDVADSRFYLNPPVENTIAIYKEIYERAEAEGLKFRAKVLDFDLRARGQRKTPEGQREKAEKWSKNPSLRNDPMVFYGFAESKERLYEIIKEVYSSNESIFKGRELGFAPHEIAPGFGVGEEPKELTGKESLSSFLEFVIGDVTNSSNWKEGKNAAEQKMLFAQAFRKKITNENLPINPDNIAFR